MSRLIDADALMEYVLNLKDKMIGCNDIARFSTAYDTGNVIEQLENEAVNMAEFFTDDYRDDYYRGAYATYCYAIEIVKRGGVK